MEKKLYVITSDRIDDPVYAAVQGGHAVAEFLMEQEEAIANKNWSVNYEDKWYNDTLVYLKADLSKAEKMLEAAENEHHGYWFSWQEPDLNNETTAIAFLPSGGYRDVLKGKARFCVDPGGLREKRLRRFVKWLDGLPLLGKG
jgi:hypothetical protein